MDLSEILQKVGSDETRANLVYAIVQNGKVVDKKEIKYALEVFWRLRKFVDGARLAKIAAPEQAPVFYDAGVKDLENVHQFEKAAQVCHEAGFKEREIANYERTKIEDVNKTKKQDKTEQKKGDGERTKVGEAARVAYWYGKEALEAAVKAEEAAKKAEDPEVKAEQEALHKKLLATSLEFFERALPLYERANNHARAGELAEVLGQKKRAAENYKKAGQTFAAFTMLRDAGEHEEAVDVLIAGEDIRLAAAYAQEHGFRDKAQGLYKEVVEKIMQKAASDDADAYVDASHYAKRGGLVDVAFSVLEKGLIQIEKKKKGERERVVKELVRLCDETKQGERAQAYVAIEALL